jgi:hypothetical protein
MTAALFMLNRSGIFTFLTAVCGRDFALGHAGPNTFSAAPRQRISFIFNDIAKSTEKSR